MRNLRIEVSFVTEISVDEDEQLRDIADDELVKWGEEFGASEEALGYDCSVDVEIV